MAHRRLAVAALLAISLIGWHSPATGQDEPKRPAEGREPASPSDPESKYSWQRSSLNIGGVFPHMTVRAPGAGSRSETGIGALIPWADRLWAVGYVAHIQGSGIGLYEIRDDMAFRLHPESVTGTFANRMIHWETQQAVIGPHLIDERGNVRTLKELSGHRLAATARHLQEPKTKAYYLTMEGLLFEADLRTLEVRKLSNLVKELGINQGYIHFKGAHTAQGRLVVANNSYNEEEFLGKRQAGRLAEWDGKTWTVLEANPFIEVSGKNREGDYYGDTLFATGWDRSSVILRVLHNGTWTRYLLPKASQSFDHEWNTEWMRIREAQTERYLMDIHGMFYELPPLVYGGKVWGIRPIAHHLRIVPDFCHWRGLFVMASDQADRAVGQPQSGLWFGSIDDLWKMGKPTGWGGPWWASDVTAGAPSDPFLMTGFDKKVIHLSQESQDVVRFKIEVDFLGNGHWKPYKEIDVRPGGYEFHVFPDGYSAHWVRIAVDRRCKATAYLMYN
jgi:hypothetical protein